MSPPDETARAEIRVRDAGPPAPTPEEYGRFDSIEELLHYLGGKDRTAIEEVARLIKAIQDNGGKGKVVITVAVGDHEPGLDMTAEIASTLPKPKSSAKLVYADAQGFPARRDPWEPQLPLGRVRDTD